MHRRSPTAAHQQRVAGQDGGAPRQPHLTHTQPARGAGDGRAREDRQPRVMHGGDRGAFRGRARVRDAGDGHARGMQCQRRAIRTVIVRRNDGATANLHAISLQVNSSSVGQHDPGPVIVREHQRPLDCPRRQNHRGRAHLPQPLARQARIRCGEVIGDPLRQPDEIVREPAERGGARQQRKATACGELRQRIIPPCAGRSSFDRRIRLSQQRSSNFLLLVAQNDPRAGRGCRQRRSQPGRAATDHQNLAMCVVMQIATGIRHGRRVPQTRRTTDGRFVQPPPQRARPHEGLVVESGGQQRRHHIRHRADIEPQRRPPVLALRAQPVVQRDLCRALVRRDTAAAAVDRDQRVGFLRAGRQDAARPMIFERAPHQVHVIGEQGGGQCIALATRIAAPVEVERQRPVAPDAAAGRRAEGLGHGRSGRFWPER